MGLKSDKAVKKEFKEKATKEFKKYYSVAVLEKYGFVRAKCSTCSMQFWSLDTDRKVCGDSACAGGFTFFENTPVKKKLGYVETYKEFAKFMEKRGYTPIDRYPVVARWRDDTDFVQASIYNFQPYVVSGEIAPPANPLVVGQPSLRFNDIDNVGITMSHYSCFVMIGQLTFVGDDEWNQDKYFEDLLMYFHESIGIPLNEIVLHEDAWAGGGNFGPCMEFFSRGLELANQVYMMFEQTDEGYKELPIRVLDMGMGHERVCWFTQGKGTSYDSTFPLVMERLLEKTGVVYDEELLMKYLPYGSYLNMDEIDDLDATWEKVAKDTGVSSDKLKEFVMPLSALYSVAEHARTLLVALSDGALPSNVGGGYNLRVLLRRALGFITSYNWDVDFFEVCKWHAEELHDFMPELSEHLDDVEKVLRYEITRYDEVKQKHVKLIDRLLSKGEKLSDDKFVTLYNSQGITPDDIVKAAKVKEVDIEAPENFYALLAEKNEETAAEVKTATKKDVKLDLSDVEATEALYFDHYDYVDFTAEVVKVIDEYVILDRSAFYPTSGGQIHDVGMIDDVSVLDVFKQATPKGNVIVHKVSAIFGFTAGDKVTCKVDMERRTQLAQHHTATHILTGSARAVLGNHVWQAGAAKTLEKGRLDITHYKQLASAEIKAIEEYANKIVDENRPVVKSFMDRTVAELNYGFRLYQGGAVPGKKLRIVNIEDFDVEACGGTHLDVTGDTGHIKIIKTSKIQDGVLRLEFVSGKAAEDAFIKERKIVSEALALVGGVKQELPSRVAELFMKWKKAKKGKLDVFALESSEKYEGDVVAKMAEVLRTQPEHVVKTIARFKSDIEKKLAVKKE